ncbi:hypothetical protein JHK87_004689 [Glycine soja]|nr:hypothetical protein JHK87_004689 [Glycine soja]
MDVFRKEGESVVYVNGIKHTHKVTDFDKWCFFEAVGVVKGNLRTYGEESPNSIGEYKALKVNEDQEPIRNGDGSEEDHDSDEASDVYFGDSEEERALGLDDDFGDVVHPVYIVMDEEHDPTFAVEMEQDYESEELDSFDGSDIEEERGNMSFQD